VKKLKNGRVDGKNILRVNVDRSKDYREMMENGFKRVMRVLNNLSKPSQMK